MLHFISKTIEYLIVFIFGTLFVRYAPGGQELMNVMDQVVNSVASYNYVALYERFLSFIQT